MQCARNNMDPMDTIDPQVHFINIMEVCLLIFGRKMLM